MPTFIAHLSDIANQSMLDCYNNYKHGNMIDDCWEVKEEDNQDHGPYYKEHPIQRKDCPIFESADHNVDTIDEIGAFCVIESPIHCIWFDRCKSNEHWDIN